MCHRRLLIWCPSRYCQTDEVEDDDSTNETTEMMPPLPPGWWCKRTERRFYGSFGNLSKKITKTKRIDSVIVGMGSKSSSTLSKKWILGTKRNEVWTRCERLPLSELHSLFFVPEAGSAPTSANKSATVWHLQWRKRPTEQQLHCWRVCTRRSGLERSHNWQHVPIGGARGRYRDSWLRCWRISFEHRRLAKYWFETVKGLSEGQWELTVKFAPNNTVVVTSRVEWRSKEPRSASLCLQCQEWLTKVTSWSSIEVDPSYCRTRVQVWHLWGKQSQGLKEALRWMRKASSSCELGNLRTNRPRAPVGGEPLDKAKHQAEWAWTTRKTVERKCIGSINWTEGIESWYRGARRGGARGCAPARGADDVDTGYEVAQSGVSNAESVGSDELREPRRRNSPSDPSSGEKEDHVLTEHTSFRNGMQLVSKGVVEPRDIKEKAARIWKMARRSQSYRGIAASLEPQIDHLERRWNSVETILFWWCMMEWPNHLLLIRFPHKESTSQVARKSWRWS